MIEKVKTGMVLWMQRTAVALLAVAFGAAASAQSLMEIKANTDEYIYGEGRAQTNEEASDLALRDLLSKICVVVSSEFDITTDEEQQNGSFDARQYVHSKVETYSAATLSGTESIVVSNEPDADVVRWMRRSDVDQIFANRVLKVKEYVGLAMRAERDARVDDALRYYYWAFTLLKSTPHAAGAQYTDEQGETHSLAGWIPEQMNRIFTDVEGRVVAREGDNVTLSFTFRGKPVSSLDYTYFDGRSWSNIYSARNGKGTLELASGSKVDHFQLKYEYVFRGEATNIDRETAACLKVVKGQALRKSYATVGGASAGAARNATAAKAQSATAVACQFEAPQNTKPYELALGRIRSAIKLRRPDDVRDLFTDEGWDMYTRLIHYGNARLLSSEEKVQFYRHGDGVVARSVPMSFSFKNGVRKAFVENVVFTFAADERVDCVAFGLDQQATEDIQTKGSWPNEARLNLIEFLENYKTAYALKRLDYIRSIFDDNAVIIVGHIAKTLRHTAKGDQPLNFSENKAVRRTRMSKEQYMKNLEACFKSNEFVNIRFGNNDVIKSGKGGEIYGIQLKQDYYSSSYGDQGYLFLRVDINDPKQPIISVRTWQPEPDPVDGLYGLYDF